MKTVFSRDFDKKLEKLIHSQPKLLNKVVKQIKIFQFDHKHPSLRNHKLSGILTNCWSVSVNMNIRMMYKIRADGTAYFFDIGTHNEVYRK